MNTIQTMAEEIARGLREALPQVRRTVVQKLALAVGAMMEVRTPNPVELANVLPLDTARSDLRKQRQRVVLSLNQTDLGDRFAVLMLGLVLGDRVLPLTCRHAYNERSGYALLDKMLHDG